jgi:flagellar biogenesis protein FliO
MAMQHSQDMRFPVGDLRQSLNNMPGKTEVSKAVRVMYRLGYAAKGLVFAIIGVMALMLMLGMGGQLSNPTDALKVINRQPFGQFLLLATGISLLGFVLWRVAQSIFNVEHKPNKPMNIAKRIGYAISGATYLSLAILAIRGFSEGRVQNSEGSVGLTAKALDMPAGPMLVMLTGAIIIGVGIFHAIYGLTKRFMKQYEQGRMTEKERDIVEKAGMIGLPARGFTFGIIGYFFIRAGMHANAAETRNTKGVMEHILSMPMGELILAIIAVGFVCYAVYCFAAARFRRFA